MGIGRLKDGLRLKSEFLIHCRPPETGTTLPRPGDWEVDISRLFSWETQVEAMALYEQAAGPGAEKIDALRPGEQGVFETWRNWVAAAL